MITKSRATAFRFVAAAVLLVTAALVWQMMPNKLQSWAPIAEKGRVGERIVGREFAVTVDQSILTNRITYAEYSDIHDYPGIWVVVVVTYESLTMPAWPQFELATLGKRYTSFRQAHKAVEFQTTGATGEQPGLPKRGVLAFQVPSIPDRAELLVTNRSADKFGESMYAPLDSQIVVQLTLDDPPKPSVDLDNLESVSK